MRSSGTSLPADVGLLNPLEHPGWDARLLTGGQASIFYSAAWARVLVESYGFRPFYLTADDGSARPVIPLMEVSSWLTGKRGVSLPFTDECELSVSQPGLPLLLSEALTLGGKRGWKYLELRGCSDLKDFNREAQPSISFFSHSLALSPGSDDLFSRFEGSVRRAIRRSEKAGIQVEMSQNAEAIRKFYQLHCMTRKKHGVPPQPLCFFLNIGKHILSQNLGVIVSARQKNRTIASAIFFRFGKDAIYKFGASDPQFQDLRPNNLVMWTAIQHFAKNKIATLNFGRTSLTNEGLRRFKLGWGATERTVDYFKYDFRQGTFVRGRDESSGWYNNLFRTLPRFISRWSGALLYKHIA